MTTHGGASDNTSVGSSLENVVATATAVAASESETRLVIAVCVLGTLVGVAVVALLVLLLVRLTCWSGGRWAENRKWVRHRDRRTREEHELHQLAAATGNFISDSMLPGNRTGASENLGIRSPNPSNVPALRVPEDLSPSPPFPLPLGVAARPTMRERLPSPQRGHRRTVLNTLVPHNTPERAVVSSEESDSLSDADLSLYRRGKTSKKGDYERLPSASPKRKNKSRQVNAPKKTADTGYPVSDSDSVQGDEVEKCVDHGHSYYKPGGYTSYGPQRVYEHPRTAERSQQPRTERRIVYEVLPDRDDSRRDLASRSIRKKTMRGSKQRDDGPSVGHDHVPQHKSHQRRPRTDQALSSDPSNFRNIHERYNENRKVNSDETPPLASSSRNTSMDNSGSNSMRRGDALQRRNRLPATCGNMTERGSCATGLPQRSNRVNITRSQQLSAHSRGSDESGSRTGHEGSAEACVARLPPRAPRQQSQERHHNDIHPPTNSTISHILCIPSASISTVPSTLHIPGAVTYIQTSSGLVPASFVLPSTSASGTTSGRPVTSIQVATEHSGTDNGSFRANYSSAANTRQSSVHSDNNSAIALSNGTNSGSYMTTLPDLSTPQGMERDSNNNAAETPSVLYNHSHASSQYLRPSPNILQGSSSFANSRSIQFGLLQTPVGSAPGDTEAISTVSNGCDRAANGGQQLVSRSSQRMSSNKACDPHSNNSEDSKSVLNVSLSVEDLDGDDAQAPDCVPHSPPDSSTSSSAPELGTAIKRCVPVSDTSLRRALPDSISYFDSREIVEATTASMSWDHLTPDPSPALGLDLCEPGSHYTPNCRKSTNRGFSILPHLASTSNVSNIEFDDTFARQYELRPYVKIDIPPNTHVAANLNPAIEHETPSDKSYNEIRREFAARSTAQNSLKCEAQITTSMEQTMHRQNIAIRPTNIIDRFYHSENISRDSMSSINESFSLPLLPVKKNIPSAEYTTSKRAFQYSSESKTKLISMDSDAAGSPDTPLVHSQVKQAVPALADTDHERRH